MKKQILNIVCWLVILAMLLSACAPESTSDSNLATAVASAISATDTAEAETQARVEATISAQGEQEIVPTIEQEEADNIIATAVSQSDEIEMSVGPQEVTILLDPLEERDTMGISVTIVDLGDALLIETIDPEGRYLPTAHIVSKETLPAEGVQAPQLETNLEWAFRHSGTLDVEPLMSEMLGTTTLGSLHEFLATGSFENGVNILMPLPDSLDEQLQVNVFQTPASSTVLVLPVDISASTPVLAAPSPGIIVAAMIVVCMASLTTPIIVMYARSQDATVPDLLGWDPRIADFEAALAAKGGSSRPDFKHNLASTTCTDPDQLGRVVEQDPPPGTRINALEEEITLYVCDEVVATPSATSTRPSPTSTPEPVSSDVLLYDDFDVGQYLDSTLWYFHTNGNGDWETGASTLFVHSGTVSGGGGNVHSNQEIVPGVDTLTLEMHARVSSNDGGGWGFSGDRLDGMVHFGVTSEGVLQAIVRPDRSSDPLRIEIGGVDVTAWHTYRIELTTSVAKFYVDDVLVATHSSGIPAGKTMHIRLDRVSRGQDQTLEVDYVELW